MKYPNFTEEKKLWKEGYKFVAGLDEAGRGPLAGPVVAAAVAINFKFEILNLKSILNDKNLKYIKDSKQLSPKKREEFYDIITTHPDIKWGAGIVSEKVIDKINILEATKLAMQKALTDANSKLSFPRKRESRKLASELWIPNQVGNDTDGIDFLLLDGNFKIKSDISQVSIIKGDSKVMSIAMASIIAKVTRDRIMQKYHKKYPDYGFDRHKGYPTKAHFSCLQKFGPCNIHRTTFNLKLKIPAQRQG
ncbi:MAG: ribonuclease HII [Candidatus Staskawiczbacteria bacterium]|nr:ribonuclease HII [Candidatus Staskawiczbacteria bacterium]